MIKCYDEFDNIVTESQHNAEMISSYLTNLAVDLVKILPDDKYRLLGECSDLLWDISEDLPEE